MKHTLKSGRRALDDQPNHRQTLTQNLASNRVSITQVPHHNPPTLQHRPSSTPQKHDSVPNATMPPADSQPEAQTAAGQAVDTVYEISNLLVRATLPAAQRMPPRAVPSAPLTRPATELPARTARPLDLHLPARERRQPRGSGRESALPETRFPPPPRGRNEVANAPQTVVKKLKREAAEINQRNSIASSSSSRPQS